MPFYDRVPVAPSAVDLAAAPTGAANRISADVGARLGAMNLLAMVLVVYVHANALSVRFRDEVLAATDPASVLVETFLSRGLGDVAVPWFFAVSAWLFFRDVDWSRGRAGFFASKLRSRARTLAAPYLAWSALWLVTLVVVQEISVTHRFFWNPRLVDRGVLAMLQALLFDPIPYQLWFLRDLMVLCVLSPAVYLAVRTFGIAAPIVAAALWFVDTPLAILRSESLAFFTFGAFAARSGLCRFDLGPGARRVALGAWLGTASATAIVAWLGSGPGWWMHCVNAGVGVVGFYALATVLTLSAWPIVQLAAAESFVIYAGHEPLLTALKKLLFAKALPYETFGVAVYLVLPLLLVVALIVLGRLMRRFVPPLHALLTGGR